jgi:hypothetical protein
VKIRELWPSFRRARQLRAATLVPRAELLPVVVSLTSIPSRLPFVDLAIRSVLDQSQPPALVVLWLHQSLQGSVPDTLTALLGPRFEIRFVDRNRPHCKLVHALLAFPDRTVVTCDDDVMYAPTWLAELWADSVAHPGEVIGHQGRAVAYGPDGQIRPYAEWAWETRAGGVSYPAFVPLGYGGVLYPAGVLAPEVTDEQLYLELSPNNDDLWFKMMSLQAGTVSRRTTRPVPRPIPVIGAKGTALARTNIGQDKNRVQWEALCARYGHPTPLRVD